MKITQSQLRQIIKEELQSMSEGILEDPFDAEPDGMIAHRLNIPSNLPHSGKFMDELVSAIGFEARTQGREAEEVAKEELRIMRKQLEALMNNIEKRLLGLTQKARTQSQALTKSGDVVTYTNP